MRENLHQLLPKELLQEEFDKGLWHKEIAEKYNISWRQIYYLVQDYNLKLPRKNQKKVKQKYKCSKCGKEFTILHDGICNNCKALLDKLKTDDFYETSSNPLKDQIFELRKQGLGYKKIAQILGCASSTVSYHCNKETRERVRKKVENFRETEFWKYSLIKRLDDFKRRKIGKGKSPYSKDWCKKLRTAVSRFKLRNMAECKYYYNYKDVLEYFGHIVKCGLTGRKIDLTKDDYHIDHIIPVSRGGTNNLDNMQFTIPEANCAKGDMLNEEFVALCKEVCENFGYEVKKKE